MGQKTKHLRRTVAMFDTVRTVIGEEAIPLIDYLKDKQDISEFQIAKQIKAEVNWVRKMLYKLQTRNLVTYFRRKDQVKGWYISYWTLNPIGATHLAYKMRYNTLNELKERLIYEEKHTDELYICTNMCVRMLFVEATETHFSCPECGKIVEPHNNKKTIQRLKERIKTFESEK